MGITLAVLVDWQASEPLVSLQLRLENGQIGVQTKIPLSRLKPPKTNQSFRME